MSKKKIKEIFIGSNNKGKLKEIADLLPESLKIYSNLDFKIKSPVETGTTFQQNSLLKAEYFSKKTNKICLSDDSGLEVDLLKGKPGIYSSRWAGEKNNFDLAIQKIFNKMDSIKKDWKNHSNAKFICCMTLFWPDGTNYSSTGIIKGKISTKKKGKKGFGYDPIFIPDGYTKTFSEMEPNLKMSIDHRSKAFNKIKKFFV